MQPQYKMLLMCGLDYSGKTTMIKSYNSELQDYAKSIDTTKNQNNQAKTY